MREKKDVVLEYELKKEMFAKSLDVIFPEIIKKSKRINIQSPMFLAYGDLINAIKAFRKNNEIVYSLGFFFCIILGDEYQKIINSESLLDSTIQAMKNEKSWDEGDISYEVSIYFSYTFMNELYKDIAIDTHLLSTSPDIIKAFKKMREEII